uniref:Uncharacterized protein n=1 Tax=Babesia bovis TaxID=5865 RepID=S6BEK4_BABBO|nr:hypothetical protein [Babesia bovis]
MAAQHRARDLMSNSENSTEVEHAAKRHAPFQWPMMGENGNISDANMMNPVQFANNMWNPQAQQMMPPLMPGFTPMIPKNEEEARQLVAMQAAMMASGQFGQFPQVAPGNSDNDLPNQQNDQTQGSFILSRWTNTL